MLPGSPEFARLCWQLSSAVFPHKAIVHCPLTVVVNYNCLQAPPAKPVVLIVSGPSGVGKDSVVQRLQELRPDMHFVVTATSRCAPRTAFPAVFCTLAAVTSLYTGP